MKNFSVASRWSLVVGLLLAACSSNYTRTPQQSEIVMPQSMGSHPPIVSGKIEVAPALKGKVQNGSALFVIAKPAAGGPPLAVKRLSAEYFPMDFTLMPQDIMMQGASMEGDIVVLARIDKDGLAGPAGPGDLEGKTAKPVALGTTGVNIKIDKVYSLAPAKPDAR